MAMVLRSDGSALTGAQLNANFGTVDTTSLTQHKNLWVNSITVGSGNTASYARMYHTDNSNWRYIHCNSNRIGFLNSSNAWANWLDDSGNWQTAGDTLVQGNITGLTSDDRLKTKIGPIDNALEKLLSIEGFYYHQNELAKSYGFEKDGQQVGCSAQEVQKVLPEVIVRAPFDMINGDLKASKTGENYMTIKYDRLVPLVIEAIKEMNNKITNVEAKMENL